MNEGIARGDPNRIISDGEINTRLLGNHECLARCDQLHPGQVIGRNLKHGGRSQPSGMQYLPANYGQDRQHFLKGGSVSTSKNCDIAGRRPVTPSGYRRVQCESAEVLYLLSKTADFFFIRRTHFQPYLAGFKAFEDTIGLFHHSGRHRWRWQAGNHHIRVTGKFRSTISPASTRRQQRCSSIRLDVMNHQIVTMT